MSTQRPNHARTVAGRRGCHRRASWPPSLSLGRQPTMRASVFTLLLVGILAAVGCSHSGDFGGFFVAEVTRYGGHTITNATLPRLDARWTVKADSNGFTVQVRGVPFATVDSFMHQAFGPPKVSADANLDGQPQRVWAAVDVGVAVQCIGRPDGVEIVCLKAGSMPFSGGR